MEYFSEKTSFRNIGPRKYFSVPPKLGARSTPLRVILLTYHIEIWAQATHLSYAKIIPNRKKYIGPLFQRASPGNTTYVAKNIANVALLGTIITYMYMYF